MTLQLTTNVQIRLQKPNQTLATTAKFKSQSQLALIWPLGPSPNLASQTRQDILNYQVVEDALGSIPTENQAFPCCSCCCSVKFFTPLSSYCFILYYTVLQPIELNQYYSKYNTLYQNTIQYNTLYYNTMQYNILYYNAIQCTVLQYYFI